MTVTQLEKAQAAYRRLCTAKENAGVLNSKHTDVASLFEDYVFSGDLKQRALAAAVAVLREQTDAELIAAQAAFDAL